MERERTFLQRLSQEKRLQSRGPAADEDAQALMESVREHLNHLLNARHGMSEGMPDYGLPALTDLVAGSGDHANAVGTAIKNAIEKYEPRLRRVRVSCQRDEDPNHRQTLTFRIEAMLVGRRQEHRVWYETSLKGDGGFDVIG